MPRDHRTSLDPEPIMRGGFYCLLGVPLVIAAIGDADIFAMALLPYVVVALVKLLSSNTLDRHFAVADAAIESHENNHEVDRPASRFTAWVSPPRHAAVESHARQA